MKPIKTLILISTIALMFSACGTKKSQTRKYFRLTSSPTVLNTDIKPMTLVVKRPSALSILGGRPIVATQDDDSLVQLSYNFWLESPKILLQDSIKHWAESHWQTVSYQTPSELEHQILESRILAFEKKQNHAVATLEFFLYDADNRILFNQRFSASENIAEDNYKAFAKAMSLAIASIFAQLNKQLSGQP